MEGVSVGGGKLQKKKRAMGCKKLKKAKKAGSKTKKAWLPTANILSLPTEIVLLITELLEVKDQVAFNLVSKALYSIIDPLLYENNVKSGQSYCLFWGAGNGQLGTVKKALAAGADLNMFGPDDSNTRDPVFTQDGSLGESGEEETEGDDGASGANKLNKYSTPLHLAAKNGHRDVVAFLLDNGVDIDAPSYKMCDCKVVKSHHSTLQPNYPRWRALHLAMCYGSREVAELLIFRGASLSLDAVPGRYHTALHTAAAKGLIPIIKLLALDLKFNVDERDSDDNTALHYVAELFGSRDHDAIRDTITKLLALGAELEAHNEMGYTPLLNACCRGNFAVALRLLGIGANPDPHRHIPNFRDYRPLYYAVLPRAEFFDLNHAPVKHDDFEGLRVNLIKSLAEAGANIDARFDKRGHRNVTPLMLACEVAEPRAVAALLQAGAQVNSVDRSGKTAILYACIVRVDHRGEVPEIVTLLIRHGAWIDVDEPSLPPASALDWAVKNCRWGDGDVLNAMLRAAGPDNVGPMRLKVVLRRCSSNGNYKAMGPLLEFTQRLYGVNRKDLKEYMDLIIEQRDPANQRETFQTLMDFGYHVDTNEVLLLKSMMQKNEVLSLAVLDRGVAVSDVKLRGDQTYLHVACEWGNMNVVKALLERAADVNAFDRDLRTPLLIAVSQNHQEMAVALMNEVAYPHLLPPDDVLEYVFDDVSEREFVKKRYLTPFDIAIRESRTEILKAMLTRFAAPDEQHKNELTYLRKASENPNTRPLEMLLDRGYGRGSQSLDPAISILRHMWDNPSPPEVAASSLKAVILLLQHCKSIRGPLAQILQEIFAYDGLDEDRQILRQLTHDTLTISFTMRNQEGHVCSVGMRS